MPFCFALFLSFTYLFERQSDERGGGEARKTPEGLKHHIGVNKQEVKSKTSRFTTFSAQDNESCRSELPGWSADAHVKEETTVQTRENHWGLGLDRKPKPYVTVRMDLEGQDFCPGTYPQCPPYSQHALCSGRSQENPGPNLRVRVLAHACVRREKRGINRKQEVSSSLLLFLSP